MDKNELKDKFEKIIECALNSKYVRVHNAIFVSPANFYFLITEYDDFDTESDPSIPIRGE